MDTNGIGAGGEGGSAAVEERPNEMGGVLALVGAGLAHETTDNGDGANTRSAAGPVDEEAADAAAEDDGPDGEDATVADDVTLEPAVDATDARDRTEEATPAAETTEADGQPASDTSPSDYTPDGNSGEGNAAADGQAVLRLSQQALGSLLDELTAELVTLEAFDGKVDDRARENEWLGKHTPISLAVFQEELDRTGKYTFNVDENGVLLDDPVKFRLAREAGAQITLRVHHGLSEAKKSNFILLAQGRDRERTEAENRELKRRIILAALLQGLTYEATAELACVHPNTARNVEKRAAADPNSKLEITQPPDGRYGSETREKIAKAAKLRKEGKSNAEIAETFGTDVETVGKWLKDRPARDKAKGGKDKKKTPARRKEPIEDLAANDGPSDLHQRALEHLGLDAEYYDERHDLAEDRVQETVGAISGSVEDLLDFAIYGRKLAAAADARLEELLRAGVEEDAVEEDAVEEDAVEEDAVEEDAVEEEPVAAPGPSAGEYELGEILSGTVLVIEPDEVLVELPKGDRGVIGASDEGLTWHGQPDEGEEVQVEVNGFDSERELFELGLVDRDPMREDESVDFVEPDLDDLSPYERHFGGGEGSEE